MRLLATQKREFIALDFDLDGKQTTDGK